MGAGVSLSLSRDGVHGESILSSIFSLISDPFPREYDFHVISVPCSREQDYYGSNLFEFALTGLLAGSSHSEGLHGFSLIFGPRLFMGYQRTGFPSKSRNPDPKEGLGYKSQNPDSVLCGDGNRLFASHGCGKGISFTKEHHRSPQKWPIHHGYLFYRENGSSPKCSGGDHVVIHALAKKGIYEDGFQKSDLQITHAGGQPYRKGALPLLPQNRGTYKGVPLPDVTSTGASKWNSDRVAEGSPSVTDNNDVADSLNIQVTVPKMAPVAAIAESSKAISGGLNSYFQGSGHPNSDLFLVDLFSAASGCGLWTGSDALSVIPQIPEQENVDPGRLGVVGWPVWPDHGRGALVICRRQSAGRDDLPTTTVCRRSAWKDGDLRGRTSSVPNPGKGDFEHSVPTPTQTRTTRFGLIWLPRSSGRVSHGSTELRLLSR